MGLFEPQNKKGEGRPNGGEGKEGQKKKGGTMMPQNSMWNNMLTIILVFLSVVLIFSFFMDQEEIEEISLSRLANDITAGEIEEIVVRGHQLEVFYLDGTERESRKESGVALSDTLVNYGVSAEELRGIEIDVQRQTGLAYWLMTLGPFILPLLLILLILWFILRQAKGAGMQAFSFGQSKARLVLPNDRRNRVTFKDVAGAKEAKQELMEIVDFLKNPKKFINIGAQIPKGILMMGAPGTGKTLLAKAVAGEARVAFMSISGSEFVEMFVGVGASRVRDMFKLAKQSAPAIIFIDEIDAIGRVRGSGVGGGNDEREQTLNQILVEMDGFEPNEKVIVMAATNRPDVLDPALLRPGRFDRRVTIDLPDRHDREAILVVQANKKPLADDVEFSVIAERTPGFSGADLYSLVNEAAILAARESRKSITQFDLVRSIEKVMLGPERQSHVLSEREKSITAYHEAGHAIIASVLPYADPVHKVSVISRGRAAGYTLKLPVEDRRLQSRREFIDDIAVSLGGYVAEQMMFDDLTTGSSNDLQVSTATARNMVTRYGMSDKIGPVALEEPGGAPIYGKSGDAEYSERVSAEIDAEVSRIMQEGLETARRVIEGNKEAFEAVAKRLIEVENLEREEYEKILADHGVDLKHKEEKKETPLEKEEREEGVEENGAGDSKLSPGENEDKGQ